MVVGGGIAGVQAALDLADTGFYVYIIESSEAIGGVMSALDKTFPTNDCSMCILSPKLVECGRHPNIEIITLAEVQSVAGKAGNFQVKVFQRARFIDMDKCIACGACAEKCPRKVANQYNLGLNKRKAAYVKYPQAVPLKYAIDKDHCIYFEKGKCRACEKFCPTNAVNFEDTDREITLNVGSIILAPGLQPFDPTSFDSYGYARHPNVITAMELERILSPSGPTRGKLIRPSDGGEPERIAWLQCVGSRDINHCDNGYCSAVCCTYAIKEAVVAKEHIKGSLDTAIFYIDMRTHGKDFEKYYNRAKQSGVRFIKARISIVFPVYETGNLFIRYTDGAGRRVEEEFDMIVLSVGLETSPAALRLAERLGIELDDGRFALTSPFRPVTTTRPGIFVCGAFQGPKDIPQSVMEASAAAAETATLLAPARASLVREAVEFEEVDVAGEEPRIGVFVCHCGVNIGSVVNVPAVKEYAKTLHYVEYVEENLFSCSQDTQDTMKEVIAKHKLNRIVVASCSPRTHEPLFQQTIREAGLNKYLFEMANIRDQNSWVHQAEPDAATGKAKDLVRMAVAKVGLQQPLEETKLPVTKSGLVIGGGVAGMEAALTLADQGYPVTVVEKEDVLGGHARKLLTAWTGEPIASFLEELIQRVQAHPIITMRLNSEVKEVKGFVGNFSTTVEADGIEEQIPHGVAIIAAGAHFHKPTEYCYGENDRIYLSLELDEAIRERCDAVVQANSAVFIQCVGSREPERPYCSRVCCTHSIKNALRLKEINPQMDVAILYRDIRTYGLREGLYRKARRKGVMFIRFNVDRKPQVEIVANELRITVFDLTLQRSILLKPGILTLASAITASKTESLAKLFKVPLNPEGFFLEAHMKLRPVDFATDGVYVAGLAHWPKPTEECIAQAKAAAARAARVLAKDFIAAGGAVAVVDKKICCGCQSCLGCCPFEAVSYLEQEARCEINQAVCKGCGTCGAACPSEAITLLGLSNQQIYKQIDEGLSG